MIGKSPPDGSGEGAGQETDEARDGPWPPLEARRLSEAAAALATQVDEPALRAQLHGLATAIGCLPAQGRRHPERDELQRALERALAEGDEPAVAAAARRLAAHDRSLAQAVDWSAVSGG